MVVITSRTATIDVSSADGSMRIEKCRDSNYGRRGDDMTFDEYLTIIANGHMFDLINTASPEVQDLLTRGCNLFERFPHSDQLMVMAVMAGMVFGTLEGEHVPAEATFGVMITHQHRLQQLVAQVCCVFWDSMEARGEKLDRVLPTLTFPKAKKVKAKKVVSARVLQMVSGKRKKEK